MQKYKRSIKEEENAEKHREQDDETEEVPLLGEVKEMMKNYITPESELIN